MVWVSEVGVGGHHSEDWKISGIVRDDDLNDHEKENCGGDVEENNNRLLDGTEFKLLEKIVVAEDSGGKEEEEGEGRGVE